MFFYNGAAVRMMQKKSEAANIPISNNPPYAVADFISFFPQFKVVCTVADRAVDSQIPQALLNNFISRANATLMYSKLCENWQYCMGLFIAHFATLFLQASSGTDVNSILDGSQPNRVISSESVDGVSASYDTNSSDTRFAEFKTTIYGQQLITYLKFTGLGGMVV